MTRLTTARLVLRPHAIADEALYRAFWGADVPQIEGVVSIAPLDPELTFARLLRFLGHWSAFGFGPFVVEELATGRIVGEDVQIAVADNGPGISPDVKANVFERFSAKDQAGNRAGAGLGLALVNRFLELHDGWVEIESGSSARDSGTLVRCHLPRRIHDDEPHPEVSGDKRTAYL